jgi:hypothetical protein
MRGEEERSEFEIDGYAWKRIEQKIKRSKKKKDTANK